MVYGGGMEEGSRVAPRSKSEEEVSFETEEGCIDFGWPCMENHRALLDEHEQEERFGKQGCVQTQSRRWGLYCTDERLLWGRGEQYRAFLVRDR